jgi:hypothetical protein
MLWQVAWNFQAHDDRTAAQKLAFGTNGDLK